MTPFLKAVGLPITMKLELSGSIPGQPQHWNVLFLQLFWREHVGQLTSSLQKKQLSPYGEKQGGKRACSQVNCLQSGSSHLRLECNNPGGFWPGKLLKWYRKRNLLFFFFFFPKAHVIFNASCTLFIPLCSPCKIKKIPFENANLPLMCYGGKRKITFFHK